MNMKMKTLAAAVLMAAGGQAMAATANTLSGNSELIFNVYDPVALTSFSMDLAPIAGASQMGSFHLNDFLPAGVTAGGLPSPGGAYTQAPGSVEAANINWSWTLGADNGGTATADWATFQSNVASAGSNSSNWLWNVFAGDHTGAAGLLDQRRVITTSLTGEAAMDTGINLANVSLLNDLFNSINTSGFADDETLVGVQGDSWYYPATVNDTLRNVTTSNVMAHVGDSASFFYVSGTSPAFPQPATPADAKQFQNGATWTFDGTSLNYSTASAVPVPAAVWLLGSALVGLVGVSRRREAEAA
jgi:hypothetical protein